MPPQKPLHELEKFVSESLGTAESSSSECLVQRRVHQPVTQHKDKNGIKCWNMKTKVNGKSGEVTEVLFHQINELQAADLVCTWLKSRSSNGKALGKVQKKDPQPIDMNPDKDVIFPGRGCNRALQPLRLLQRVAMKLNDKEDAFGTQFKTKKSRVFHLVKEYASKNGISYWKTENRGFRRIGETEASQLVSQWLYNQDKRKSKTVRQAAAAARESNATETTSASTMEVHAPIDAFARPTMATTTDVVPTMDSTAGTRRNVDAVPNSASTTTGTDPATKNTTVSTVSTKNTTAQKVMDTFFPNLANDPAFIAMTNGVAATETVATTSSPTLQGEITSDIGWLFSELGKIVEQNENVAERE